MPAASAADLASARQRAPERFGGDLTLADLETGRELYAERCSSCHQLQLPSAHSAAQWDDFVAQMGPRAALSTAEERAVLLYLQALATH
jgi:cytochrome c5